ncbi:MAG: F0F1 ATP synthase subunit alpha, partial [Bacteroidales bacterium]|nr:F0F1 ATP synthase subunit alpha [Bacteroidales bacterium]
KQIAIIYCGTKGLLKNVPVENVKEFEKEFLEFLEVKHYTDVLKPLSEGKLTDQITNILEEVAGDIAEKYNKGN